MTMSSTITTVFTRTHAKHLASKVVSDLYQCHSFYAHPSEAEIANYHEELIVMLAGGYVSTYEFGFTRGDQRVVAWQYCVSASGDLVGGTDDRSGGVYARADTRGADYYNFMSYSSSWFELTDAERGSVGSEHPIDRTAGELPSDGIGYWVTDRTYTSSGVSVERKTYRPL